MIKRITKHRPSFARPRFDLTKTDSIAPWILFILVSWLCWQLASLFWLMLNPPTAPVARMVALGGNASANIPNIIGFKLFAENSVSTDVQSNVPMHLEGVFVAQPANQSAAVINVNNVSTRYRVGQQIDGTNYQLAAVSWNVVSLQLSDGSMQQLKFGDANASGISNDPVQPNQGIVAVAPPPTAAPPRAAMNAAQQAQAALGDAVRQLKENPNGYIGQMGLVASGAGKGYEVTNNVPANVRSQLGLRTGDKIISVNGQPVGNPATDAQLVQQVQQSHSAQVQIQRGDQTLTIQQSF